ncbi:armadillo repeat-containing protein [Heterostelium album PN500]|uniref:Armadillo repeat-containing protein n=1 Tax=Heterostelium pallidum (strain ATCC 26659 / Pp 5 / PN500) TaxID=670386 RepID=D3B7B2_HETP5|nr:armadillo repeat-containing protein [Heterostelium album PN500]EFA82655.1 armadillo repeat-containing protein [Heterostelium album PN500]|eukprot:XP_020434772.1 armadillo repeat-containing protein [Heterostelium album PN500]
MGKITNNKKVYRVDPITGANTRNDDEGNGSASEVMNDDTAKMLYDQVLNAASTLVDDPQELLKMVDDKDANQRDLALRTVAELIIENTSFNKNNLLDNKDNLIKIIKRSSDPEPQVAVTAMGALRNLTIVNPESCDLLLSSDILTSLISNFNRSLEFISTIQNNKYTTGPALENQHILLQSLSLLTNLCELSDSAFEVVSNSVGQHFSKLFQLLIGHSLFLEELVFYTCEFLSIITENNAKLSMTVGNDLLMQLYKCVSESKMSIKLLSLISVTLLNIGSHYHRDKVVELITPLLLPAFTNFQPVASLLAIKEKRLALKEVTASSNNQEEEEDEPIEEDTIVEDGDDDDEVEDQQMGETSTTSNNNNNGDTKEPKKAKSESVTFENEAEKMEEQWRDSLSAQQTAIEIFTNILSDDGQQQPSDNPYDEDDKFLDVQDIESAQDQDVSPLIKYLESTTLLANLIELIESIELQDITKIVKECTELMQLAISLKTMYKRAIQCLSNLLISFSKEKIHSHQRLWDLMLKISAHSIHNGQISQAKTEIEQLEIATSSLWSLMRNNSSIGFNNLDEIKNILFITSNAPTLVKTNLIGMIGLMGQKDMCKSILNQIGQLFVYCLANDQNAEVIAETLNSIFDVFAEPPVNQVFKELNMMSTLEQYVPILRNKIKTDKKKLDRQMLDRLDESRINLTRFIQYKKQQKY